MSPGRSARSVSQAGTSVPGNQYPALMPVAQGGERVRLEVWESHFCIAVAAGLLQGGAVHHFVTHIYHFSYA